MKENIICTKDRLMSKYNIQELIDYLTEAKYKGANTVRFENTNIDNISRGFNTMCTYKPTPAEIMSNDIKWIESTFLGK